LKNFEAASEALLMSQWPSMVGNGEESAAVSWTWRV